MTAITELLSLMHRLRDKNTGCPWDIEQNFHSIAPHTIEEAYEVADAISRDDMEDLQSELGDLLLQVVFHAQIAKENGLFDFEDIARTITHKLIRRHPHIFADDAINSASEQVQQWEALKAKEREAKAAKKGQRSSLLDDVPRNLPAMIRASKLQKRAANVGFNWEQPEQIIEKLEEELTELKAELHHNNTNRISEELGDIFFVICNIANHYHINPEAALATTNAKFERRFNYIEAQLANENRTPEQATLDEMDRFWNEIRVQEKEE